MMSGEHFRQVQHLECMLDYAVCSLGGITLAPLSLYEMKAHFDDVRLARSSGSQTTTADKFFVLACMHVPILKAVSLLICDFQRQLLRDLFPAQTSAAINERHHRCVTPECDRLFQIIAMPGTENQSSCGDHVHFCVLRM